MDWSVLYIVATLLILPAFIYGGISQAAATSTFDKYAKQTTNNNIQANELARKLLQSANLNNVAVVDKASYEVRPYNMSVVKENVIYLFLGVVLSLGIIFIIYTFDTTIKGEEDIEDKLNLIVLGSVPKVGDK